jgi:serine/threonine-protein kinase
LFEALTGHVPFSGESDAAAAMQHLTAEPPPTGDPALSAFDPILARALSKQPQDRFASTGEFAAAVQQAANELPDWTPAVNAIPKASGHDPPGTSQPTQPA